ncbi:MAG TPA: hypothetical protein VGY54_26070, partial [Polyangiaceae bacterium]|nr:hypothetical protein [Polyangiaceae bacterium]
STGVSPNAGSGPTGSGATGSATGGSATDGSATDGSANDASTDAPANVDGSSDRGDAAGPLTTAGCANHSYPLCIDFENGIDGAVWTGGTPGAIVSDDVAHGTHSYRLYPMSGGTLKTNKMGTIKNQVWGRFYVHFKPGAPGGHGAIVGVFDQSNNWYEIGWQFDGMMGVWHAASNAERPLRSMPLIVDRWYCVEYFFDGATAAFPQWWIDGHEAQYYMAANTALAPKGVTQFTNLFIGFTPYAGLGLQMPDGKGPIDTRVLTNMWIDDIALDTQRIGCIQ